MRKLLLSLSLVGLAACADKLTGPEAQAAVAAHRDDVPASGVLVFVNGAEISLDSAQKIDAAHIESVEVKKGKAALAIYGERASKGAIFVTLKQGK